MPTVSGTGRGLRAPPPQANAGNASVAHSDNRPEPGGDNLVFPPTSEYRKETSGP